MGCLFCRSEERLTDEHVFPAFMGGELEVRNGSCERCNHDFGVAEAAAREATTPLLNLLQIENRYSLVPNVQLRAEIRGLDLKNLPAVMDGDGNINLRDVVRESTSEDGRRLRQGFFLTKEAGDRFAERARAKGLEVTELEVPREIVIEANCTITVHFIASLHARKLAAKIALTAIALEYGAEFALTPQFDELRAARTTESPKDLPVRFFANTGLMSAYIHTPYQHSVMCYLNAGMRKGWALVTLFGGISYLVSVTNDYTEKESRQFSIFYDADVKKCFTPVVLADEMTLIGHVLSPATKFEDPTAVHEQWSPLLNEFCAQKGVSWSQSPETDNQQAGQWLADCEPFSCAMPRQQPRTSSIWIWRVSSERSVNSCRVLGRKVTFECSEGQIVVPSGVLGNRSSLVAICFPIVLRRYKLRAVDGALGKNYGLTGLMARRR